MATPFGVNFTLSLGVNLHFLCKKIVSVIVVANCLH